jgi:SUKH-3 immunity protein
MTYARRTWGWITHLKLLFAGWRPKRNVWGRLTLPRSLSPFPEAERVLRQFGNLRFGARDVVVDFNPALGEEVADEIRMFESQLARRLYPVGIMEHQDRDYLLIDQGGIVYTLMVCPPLQNRAGIAELVPLASSFEQAIETLLHRQPRRREVGEDMCAAGVTGKVWRVETRRRQ